SRCCWWGRSTSCSLSSSPGRFAWSRRRSRNGGEITHLSPYAPSARRVALRHWRTCWESPGSKKPLWPFTQRGSFRALDQRLERALNQRLGIELVEPGFCRRALPCVDRDAEQPLQRMKLAIIFRFEIGEHIQALIDQAAAQHRSGAPQRMVSAMP